MMARRKNLCDTPRCGRLIVPLDGEYPKGNQMRGLCSRCSSSRYYWRKKRRTNPRAVFERQKRLSFWSDRLSWLFETRKGE
jgi:hypothetical protein